MDIADTIDQLNPSALLMFVSLTLLVSFPILLLMSHWGYREVIVNTQLE